MLASLQKRLEGLYRISTKLSVEDFLIDAATRDLLQPDRNAREQLLLHEQEGDLSMALYLDESMLNRLREHNPGHSVGRHNLDEFLVVLEGVSHFVYTAYCAGRDKQLSGLELELQAEVDKFVSCVLSPGIGSHGAEHVSERLFQNFSLEEGMDVQEQQRYVRANMEARRYSKSLARRFLKKGRIPEMLAELRRFYRLSMSGKMRHIAAAY